MGELRRSAWLIAAAVLLPLLLFVAFQFAFSAREERRALEAQALSESRLVIARADAALGRSIASLDALSTIDALTRGDLGQAEQRARQIAALNPDWVGVRLRRARDGATLFDLAPAAFRRPEGRPAAPRQTRFRGVQRDGAGCPCIVLERAAPGSDGGYVLTALISTRTFEALLPPRAGPFPVSAIVAPDGRFIARSLHQANRAGQSGSAYLRAAVSGGQPSGIYRGFTLEGLESYSAFARSRSSGWSAHLAFDVSRIEDPGRRFLGSLGLAALLSLTLATVMIAFALRQIAEAKRLTERVQSTQKLEALGQLTGGIAHDFNNLLTPITGALDFLVHRVELDPRARRIAGGALASAERAARLTTQLLAFSRHQRLEIVPVDVAAMLEDMRDMLVQSVGPNHRLTIAADPAHGCVWSDLQQLEVAVLNLVINARDASPSGGAIAIAALPDPAAPDDRLLLRVSDEGEGMDAATRRRALEPFFTTKTQGRGSGLGLAQVYALVRQSGGQLDIASAPGEGTTITLALRRCAEEVMDRRLPATPAPAVNRSLRLLVVDDDPAVRATLVAILAEAGHAVDAVGDGATALAAIDGAPFDLVLVDFAMPGMNGAELIAAARAVRPDCRFLMITGFSDSEAIAEASPDTPILRKPFVSEELLARVAALVA